jgi:hypothetical protein
MKYYIPPPLEAYDYEDDLLTKLQKARRGYWIEPPLLDLAVNPDLKPEWVPPASGEEIEVILADLCECGFPAAKTAYRQAERNNDDRRQMRDIIAGTIHYRVLESGKSVKDICAGLGKLDDEAAADDAENGGDERLDINNETLERWYYDFKKYRPRRFESIENYYTHREVLNVPVGYKPDASLRGLVYAITKPNRQQREARAAKKNRV